MIIAADYEKALARAKHALARRDHATSELEAKLHAWGCDVACIEQVLSDCQRLGYLNDSRFYERWIEKKAKTGMGPVLIRAMLIERYAADEGMLDAMLDAMPEQLWHQGFESRLRRHFSGQVLDQQMHEKILHYFISRGYDADYIENRMLTLGVDCEQL